MVTSFDLVFKRVLSQTKVLGMNYVYNICIFAVAICFHFTKATVDLNIRKLQMVADHLSIAECRKLSEALRQKEFLLMNNVTGSQEPNKTCIYLLLMWDRLDGKGRTFEDLDLRLRQIGRNDVANKLSVAVLHEDAVELNKKILDDPFKDMIPKESVLLDTAVETSKLNIDKREYAEPELIGSWEIICIVIGLFSVFVLVVLSFRFLCPGFATRVWRKYAPDLVIDWCDLWCKEYDICCKNCNNEYSYHVIGSRTINPKATYCS